MSAVRGIRCIPAMIVFIIFMMGMVFVPVIQAGNTNYGSEEPGEIRETEALPKIEGRILDTRIFNLSGVDESHRYVKIDTRQGDPVIADLGPVKDLDGWNFNEGDDLTVYGIEGTVNERSVFMAMRIGEKGEKSIRQPHDLDLRRIRANVRQTRISSFQKYDVPEQLFARIEIPRTGGKTVVNLGPAENFPTDLDLENQEIVFLGRPADIKGRTAFVAESVQLPDGEVLDIDWTPPQGAQQR